MNKKSNPRNHKIELRVTQEEKDQYTKMADLVNMNLSEYLRNSLKNDNVIIIEKQVSNKELESSSHEVIHKKRMLYGIANNLNQLTKLSHQEQKIHSDLSELIVKIKNILLEY